MESTHPVFEVTNREFDDSMGGCQFVCVSEWRLSLLDDVDSVWEVDGECVEACFPSLCSGAGWSSSLGCDVTHSEVQQFQGCFLVGEMAPGLGDLA